MLQLVFALTLGLASLTPEASGPAGQPSRHPVAGAQSHFYPSPADLTVCNCNPINGTCSSLADGCILACATGFQDCDNDDTNGCEADLSHPATCGTCGNNCDGCWTNPTCSAGACGGSEARLDGTACDVSTLCVGGSGECAAGSCVCSSSDMGSRGVPVVPVVPLDMSSTTQPGGKDLGSACNMGGPDPTLAALILLCAAAGLLLLRRRRRS